MGQLQESREPGSLQWGWGAVWTVWKTPGQFPKDTNNKYKTIVRMPSSLATALRGGQRGAKSQTHPGGIRAMSTWRRK